MRVRGTGVPPVAGGLRIGLQEPLSLQYPGAVATGSSHSRPEQPFSLRLVFDPVAPAPGSATFSIADIQPLPN